MSPRYFIRYPELVERGIVPNRVWLARAIERYDFPKPLELGANSLAWDEAEVAEWLATRERRVPKASASNTHRVPA
jgi:predicted DNA-binding transcriptional regulator AlpA